MPIYEYVCESCGHHIEALQKINEDALTKCPRCAEEKLKKKVSAAAFRLKGGGWYETDFKSGNKKNLAAADKPPESKGSGQAAKSAGAGGGNMSKSADGGSGPASKKTSSS